MTYVQANSGFCRKAPSGQPNSSQMMSVSCGEKLNGVEFYLAVIRNTAFVATLLKLFKLYHLKKKVTLKIVLHTKAHNSTEKENKGEKKRKFQSIWLIFCVICIIYPHLHTSSPSEPPFCVRGVFC